MLKSPQRVGESMFKIFKIFDKSPKSRKLNPLGGGGEKLTLSDP
jgi:hypothetical protein